MDTIELVRQPPVRSFNDADHILHNSTILKEDSEEPEMLINLAGNKKTAAEAAVMILTELYKRSSLAVSLLAALLRGIRKK